MRRVVVTGMGVVSPIGVGVEAFFDGLATGARGIASISSFDASAFPTRIAGAVKDLDASAVVSPAAEHHALRRDPKSLFALLAGRQALAGAFDNIRPTDVYPAESIGTFVASGLEIFNLGDLAGHMSGDGIDGEALLQEVRSFPVMSRLQIPAHLGARCLAREAGAKGPFSVNVSACAAGTQAIGQAFRAVQRGLVDAAITGGYDSMVNPLGVGGFCLLGALSTNNDAGGAASRPFDKTRDGFVLGEGAAVFVLEERRTAERRGARIYAEIRGYASTLDAFRITDPDPDAEGAIASMRAALVDARLEPQRIDYINAHGTATPKGDIAETLAIKAVFGAGTQVAISSTKSQIGHLIGAAGAVEFLAGVFALERGVIPATINLSTPDPECDLDYVPQQPRRGAVRTVLSNSFGFGGQNATIVFETGEQDG